MTDYVSIERARTMPGLRLVATPRIPNPWTEAARAILRVKRLSYVRVAHAAGEANADLVAWTGLDNAPVLVHDDARPRAGWHDILMLAERLTPHPRLIPSDEGERVAMFGLAHELCSEDGLAWNRRLLFFLEAEAAAAKLGNGVDASGFARMNGKYGYGGDVAHARARIVAILGRLGATLRAQDATGSPYYLGERLTALDLYSATFMAMIRPLPLALCPIAPALHSSYTATDPAIVSATDAILLAHRDYIYRSYLELPIKL